MRNFVWVCCVKNRADDRPRWYFVRAFETWKQAREWVRECGPTEMRKAERFFRKSAKEFFENQTPTFPVDNSKKFKNPLTGNTT